jgi:hypothetical protein
MKRITAIAIAALAFGAFGVSTEGAFAAKNDPYAQKKAECKQEAKAKHFGISLGQAGSLDKELHRWP